jgi:hypothetical protein
LAACAPRDAPDWAELADQRVRFHAARLRTTAVAQDLDRALVGIGCPWLVFKGPALAQSVYPRPDLRFGVDLDVLVPPARFGAALSALTDDAGFELLDLNWPLIEHSAPGEVRVRSPRGVLVDLHWSVINDRSVRRVLRLGTDELLGRRRLLDGGLPALDDVDQLVHLGVHGALSGGTKLSWLLDADLAGRAIADWTDVLARCGATGTARMLAVILARAQRVWHTPVPAPVLRTLGGGAVWRVISRGVDRASPIGPDPDQPSLARAWARGVRPSAGASLAEVARRGGDWIRSGGPRTRSSSPVADAGDPRSPLHPVPDEAARARYLARVAAES